MLFATLSRVDHAWHIVAAGFLVSLLTTGLRFATGPFMSSMMASFDMTHTQFSSVVAVSLLIYGFCMPVAGRLTDLFGGRRILSAGALLLSASLVVTATTNSPTLFILTFGVLSSFGFACTSHVALSSVLGRWFVKRRGLAMTFLSSGSMSGIAFMVPLSAWLITNMGWRGTMLLFAGLILGIVLLSVMLINDQAPQQKRTGAAQINWREALHARSFWMLALTFFACGFSMNLLGTHGVGMLEDHGFSTMTAAFGIGMIGFVSIFGSLAIGAASDRLGRHLFLALIYGVRGLGFMALLFVGHEWELYLVAAVGGLVWAGSSSLTSALTADLFGAGSVGVLFGLIFLSHQFGAAAGSYIGGWGFDTFGNYMLPFALTTVLLFAAAYLSLRLPDNRALPAEVATGD